MDHYSRWRGHFFHERATVITVEDEAAGEFLKIHQPHVNEDGTILIDPDEWPILKQAIDNAKFIVLWRGLSLWLEINLYENTSILA